MMNESSASPLVAPVCITTAVVVAATYIIRVYRSSISKIPKEGPTRPKFLLDALAANEDIYYFGVGSNLSRTRLENRSISGKKIHPISFEPCVIYDFRLAFNMTGIPPMEPALGSIEPLPSFYEKDGNQEKNSRQLWRTESKAFVAYETNECHGALIKLSAEDYELVYKSEGGDKGATQFYEEIEVNCVPYDKSKEPVKAVAYRGTEFGRLDQVEDMWPSKRYMGILRSGAAELGLEDSYQKWLADHPVQEPSLFLKKVSINSCLFMGVLRFGLNMHFIPHLQTAMLYQVLVPPKDPAWKQYLGEVAAFIILFPSSLLGFALRTVLDKSGKTPPMVKKFIEHFEETM
mmetsp:Transcript_526/g.850  ORF Transcript_526/g.850 Transcript_526/m.850 type:complete len:347 (+) Transcript_526:75-1115(+)